MNAPSLMRCLPIVAAMLLTACIHTTPEIVKIGLTAPFEGRYREIGVDVIPAARAAVSEWAASYASTGLAFEVTAYDDAGNPDQATQAAQRLATDPDVAIAIGNWRDETTIAAVPIYEAASLPFIAIAAGDLSSRSPIYNLSPSLKQLAEAQAQWQSMQPFHTEIAFEQGDVLIAVDELRELQVSGNTRYLGGPLWGMSQFYTLGAPNSEDTYFISANALPKDSIEFVEQTYEQEFVRNYEAMSLGAPPGIFAFSAYQATWLAMKLMAEERGIVATAPIQLPEFDESGRIIDPPQYVYQWRDGARILVQILSTQP